jgi:hypothetical protein
MGIVEGEIESTGGRRRAFKVAEQTSYFRETWREPSPLRPLSIQDIKESTRFADLCTTSRGRVDELLLLEGSCLSASSSIFWEETSSRDCSRRSNIVASKFSCSLWLHNKAASWCNFVLNRLANILYHVTMPCRSIVY